MYKNINILLNIRKFKTSAIKYEVLKTRNEL